MWRVIAYKNGKEVGYWDMHDEYRAKQLKAEKEKAGYQCKLVKV